MRHWEKTIQTYLTPEHPDLNSNQYPNTPVDDFSLKLLAWHICGIPW